MAVYKDCDRGTWYVSCYYSDWTGSKKRHHKRGFRTKKEAVKYESEFLAEKSASMSMTLGSFVGIYFKDKENELKDRSVKNKKHMIAKHIIPYFGDMPMDLIRPNDVISWQNEMIQKGYEPTYLRMLQNQLSALFNHAEKIYNLKDNPCKKVKKMGKSEAGTMEFWTKEEFELFMAKVPKKSYYYALYEILFWCGCRLGECLALTKADIDFTKNTIEINKTFHRDGGRDIITTPKTDNSIRTVSIPMFLSKDLQTYTEMLYKLEADDRLFPISERAVQVHMKRYIEKAGVKHIRVHDLRHSHVAYLIEQGVEPLIIKERLGHKDINITLNTYGHLYPDKQKQIADLLDQLNG